VLALKKSICTITHMAAWFNRLAYAGIAIATAGGIAKTALYNGMLA
jgi:hypothetical protein